MIFIRQPKPLMLLLLSLCFLSTGCKQQQTAPAATTTATAAPTSPQQIITAQLQTNTENLFYSGTLQPLKINHVTSPVDGIVEHIDFSYGNEVKRGQLLMTINSTKSQQDYATALTNYIKDKDQFLQNKNNFEGTTALFKAGIIAREDYATQKSQLDASQLAYINSTNTLKNLISSLPNTRKNIENLTLNDVTTLEKILQQQYNKFTITAPISGIVLTSDKNSGGGDENSNSKALAVGSEVKQNQSAVDIGDTTGISVTINVSENDINRLATGQTALLTSSALPNIVFTGKIVDISKQAKTAEAGGGIASFPVTVTVPNISDQQRKLIKIGMNMKVRLIITNPPQIKIPLAAVALSKEGNATVTIIDSKSGKHKDVNVETGTTDIDSVTITKGLQAGDKVVVPAH